MMFTYWNNPELTVPPSLPIWQDRFPAFKVLGDEDVLPLLTSDQLRKLYIKISLPACKSDIARLVLLQKYGGLYIDAHAAPMNGDKLAETLDILSRYELVLFSKAWQAKAENDFNLMNTAIAARRGAPSINHLLSTAFANLFRQYRLEQENGYVPYHLFNLTGTMVMIDCFFLNTKNGYVIRPELEDMIHLYKMTGPSAPGFELYKFYNYRKLGQHWSERQTRECLFLPTS